MEDKLIKAISLKGNNVRMSIALKYNEESNSHYYTIKSRRLTSIKLRQINHVETVYSVESFTMLMEVGLECFHDNPLINPQKYYLRYYQQISRQPRQLLTY
mgnify:CR=1 FL=1